MTRCQQCLDLVRRITARGLAVEDVIADDEWAVEHQRHGIGWG